MPRKPYIPRTVPGTPGKAFFDVELPNIARAIALAQANGWSSGAGVPASTLGQDGDFYLRTSNGDVYSKAIGVWSVVMNIVGPAGATGAAGSNGANGTNGTNGTNGINGTGIAAMRSSDISTSGGLATSAGLAVAVLTGQTWAFRYVLFIDNNVTPAGNTLLSLTYPTVAKAWAAVSGINGSAANDARTVSGGATSATLGSWQSTARAPVFIDLVLRGLSASGNVDLKFASSAGNTITISDGSFVTASQL